MIIQLFMNHLEIEVKFFIKSIKGLRQDLQKIGAKRMGRVFERNLRFEDAGENLLKNRSLLRLRQAGQNRLTFKKPCLAPTNGCKVFEEIETVVDDFEATVAILAALGYQPVQTYEKWRETFETDHATVCIDTMPFGVFMEIEGAAPDIRALADRLGFKWEKRILETYLGLFDALAKEFQLGFTDITFDNFKTATASFDHFWPDFEAGRQN